MKNLIKRGKINPSVGAALSKIWEDRNEYHHLKPVSGNRPKELAREKVLRLAEVERDVFHFDVRDGKLVLKNPKYRDVSGDE